MAVINADGSCVQRYRKHHIPDDPGYYEKYYFSPACEAFKPAKTAYGTLGCMVCWDQWFPEAARAQALQGAEVLLYPSCIGSDPSDAKQNSYSHWVRTQQGHAAANNVVLVASNRIGTESIGGTKMTFHGGSFIAGPEGQILGQAGCQGKQMEEGHFDSNPKKEEQVVLASFDLDEIADFRTSWALFRDRRPDMYGALLTYDGHTRCT